MYAFGGLLYLLPVLLALSGYIYASILYHQYQLKNIKFRSLSSKQEISKTP